MPKVSLILTEMKKMGVLFVDQISYTELECNDSTYVFRYLVIFVHVKHNDVQKCRRKISNHTKTGDT